MSAVRAQAFRDGVEEHELLVFLEQVFRRFFQGLQGLYLFQELSLDKTAEGHGTGAC